MLETLLENFLAPVLAAVAVPIATAIAFHFLNKWFSLSTKRKILNVTPELVDLVEDISNQEGVDFKGEEKLLAFIKLLEEKLKTKWRKEISENNKKTAKRLVENYLDKNKEKVDSVKLEPGSRIEKAKKSDPNILKMLELIAGVSSKWKRKNIEV